MMQKFYKSSLFYGSLFTYLTATVTVNDLENEMSNELRFQGRKWGVASRVHP